MMITPSAYSQWLEKQNNFDLQAEMNYYESRLKVIKEVAGKRTSFAFNSNTEFKKK